MPMPSFPRLVAAAIALALACQAHADTSTPSPLGVNRALFPSTDAARPPASKPAAAPTAEARFAAVGRAAPVKPGVTVGWIR